MTPTERSELLEAFKRINHFSDDDVEALRRYCRRETDVMGWRKK